MKTMLILAILGLSTASFAQTYASQDVVKLLETFHNKEGVGSYYKNGEVVTKSKKCEVYLENVDVWSSDYTVTADYFRLTAGNDSLVTELQGWNPKNVEITIKGDGTRIYKHSYTGTNRCDYKEILTVKKKELVKFEDSKSCSNGRKSKGTITCNF